MPSDLLYRCIFFIPPLLPFSMVCLVNTNNPVEPRAVHERGNRRKSRGEGGAGRKNERRRRNARQDLYNAMQCNAEEEDKKDMPTNHDGLLTLLGRNRETRKEDTQRPLVPPGLPLRFCRLPLPHLVVRMSIIVVRIAGRGRGGRFVKTADEAQVHVLFDVRRMYGAMKALSQPKQNEGPRCRKGRLQLLVCGPTPPYRATCIQGKCVYVCAAMPSAQSNEKGDREEKRGSTASIVHASSLWGECASYKVRETLGRFLFYFRWLRSGVG